MFRDSTFSKRSLSVSTIQDISDVLHRNSTQRAGRYEDGREIIQNIVCSVSVILGSDVAV